MFKEVIGNTSVLTVLDARRKNKRGLYPIKIQAVHNRAQKYYVTGMDISSEDWEKLSVSKSKDLITIRKKLKDYFDIIVNHTRELVLKSEFSFHMLDVKIGNSSGGTINTALSIKIENLKNEDRIGTMRYYEDILVSIEKFGGKEIPYEMVTVEWLRKYENDSLNHNHSYSTIGMRMRGIRAMMNKARKDGLISNAQYPFGKDKYEIKTGESRKKALTMQQIAKIASYDDAKKSTEFYRDIWLFIYLCNGINVIDLVKLKYNQIVDDEIYFVREKTKRTTSVVKEIKVTITPEMQEIIDKWGNKPKPENLIFSLIQHTDDKILYRKRVYSLLKKINKRMKTIGNELAIGDVTTYTARHSFATVLKRSGANIAYISESLGHSDLRTTENYLASFEKEERQRNAGLLTGFKKIV